MKKIILLFVFFILNPALIFSQKDNTLSYEEQREGWILLFDGVSMNGWTTATGQPVPAGGWEVINGCLNTVPGDKCSDIITVSEYSDFDLSLEFKLTPGSNSGVKYFFMNYKNGGDLGCEYQIIDDTLGEDSMQANRRSGAFYDVLAPEEGKKKLNPPGEWNSIRIVSAGKKVEHWMNNVKILEFTRGDKRFKEGVAKSKFSDVKPPFGMIDKGHILLQCHGGLVSFKNIKIRVL